jgi:ketosteroid isomerase-like protein
LKGKTVADRTEIERLLNALYAARERGDLEAVCGMFAADVRFEIAGASPASRMAITAQGISETRKWLTLLVKSFQVSDLTILDLMVDGDKSAVHWRARIRSKITGVTVLTDLVDLALVKDGRIASYTEFFVPR